MTTSWLKISFGADFLFTGSTGVDNLKLFQRHTFPSVTWSAVCKSSSMAASAEQAAVFREGRRLLHGIPDTSCVVKPMKHNTFRNCALLLQVLQSVDWLLQVNTDILRSLFLYYYLRFRLSVLNIFFFFLPWKFQIRPANPWVEAGSQNRQNANTTTIVLV